MNDRVEVELYADPLWNRLGLATRGPVSPRAGVPYQATLRAIGARLDELNACRVNLMEVVDGFMVRYQLDRADDDSRLDYLPHFDLLSLSNELERKRRRHPFPFPGTTQALVPAGTYENLFRALGFELDEAEAQSLLIDELDDGMVLTYQYRPRSEDAETRKRMVILGAEAMEAAVENARARRDHRRENGARLLAG